MCIWTLYYFFIQSYVCMYVWMNEKKETYQLVGSDSRTELRGRLMKWSPSLTLPTQRWRQVQCEATTCFEEGSISSNKRRFNRTISCIITTNFDCERDTIYSTYIHTHSFVFCAPATLLSDSSSSMPKTFSPSGSSSAFAIFFSFFAVTAVVVVAAPPLLLEDVEEAFFLSLSSFLSSIIIATHTGSVIPQVP